MYFIGSNLQPHKSVLDVAKGLIYDRHKTTTNINPYNVQDKTDLILSLTLKR